MRAAPIRRSASNLKSTIDRSIEWSEVGGSFASADQRRRCMGCGRFWAGIVGPSETIAAVLVWVPHWGRLCHTEDMNATVVLGQQGRLVIPAEVRSALGLAPGDRLHLRLAGRRVVLERPVDAVEELRGLASAVPAGRSLVEELLAERRIAASTE